METLERIDGEILLWLNGWVGHFSWLDAIVRALIGDYLVPVSLSLVLLGLWFAGGNAGVRSRNQRAVLTGLIGLGVTNLAVEMTNHFLFRPRPFVDHELFLLFYRPIDSSFPANPVAFAFAVAMGVWLWNRRVGMALFGVGALYALTRVYGGVFYPLDALGGAAIGIGVSFVVKRALLWTEPFPTMVLRLARAVYLA